MTSATDQTQRGLTDSEAADEVKRIRQRRAANRRRRYRRSRLQPYRAELVQLHQAGASYADLVAWLAERQVRVQRSTVQRYLTQLPEIQEGRGGS